MRKFFTYFVIHLIGLMVISFIFLQILKKDIPDDDPFELAYKNEKINISYDGAGIPVIKTQSPASFAFSVGFLWSKDRIIQLHLWKNLFQGNLTYTTHNDSLLKTDIILKSMQIDSLSKTIYNGLSDHSREYLYALTSGFNSGMQLRSKKDELPFLFNKLKSEISNWQPSDFISILAAQTLLTGLPQHIYENNILNAEILSKSQKDFLKNFLLKRETLLPAFSKTLFLPIFQSDSGSVNFSIFEENTLPYLSYPVKWIQARTKFNVVFSTGSPFPYIINRNSQSKFIDYSAYYNFQYEFLSDEVIQKISSRKISVKKSNGETHWSLIKNYNGFNLISSETGKNLTGKLISPDAGQMNDWYSYLFKQDADNGSYISEKKKEYSFIINGQNNPINMDWLTDWEKSLYNPSNKNVYFTILEKLISTLPEEKHFSDESIISVLNLMKYEKSFEQNHSILPLLWKKYISYLNQPLEYSDSPVCTIVQLMRMPSILNKKTQLSPEAFKDFMDQVYHQYSNNPESWKWDDNFSSNFNYILSDETINKIMSANPLNPFYQLGFEEKSVLPLSQNTFLINTISVNSQDSITFIGSLNEQLNHPNFWKFNKQ